MSSYTRSGIFIGLWLIAVGLTLGVMCLHNEAGRITAQTLIIGGTMSILTDRICREVQKTNRPADEAWREGFEAGSDKGWREGFAAAQPAATVTRLEDRRRAVDGETA